MLLQALLLIISLTILYLGAELTLSSAEKVGRSLGLSPLLIGLLIIGFGTSLPELFVSHLACIRNESNIALGNIVGSNIANLFLILGMAGILVPLNLDCGDIKRQLIFHLFLTVLLAIVLMQKEYYVLSAVTLGTFFIIYFYQTYKRMHKKRHDYLKKINGIGVMLIVKLVLGFTFLYAGGELLVSSGSTLAKLMGISTYIISAIFVAFGTSFPELVTALLACYRKKDLNLITGNVIGSNIFNAAFVLSSLGIYKVGIDRTYYPEFSILLFAAIFLLLLCLLKKTFFRISGVLFLIIYGGMVAYWII